MHAQTCTYTRALQSDADVALHLRASVTVYRHIDIYNIRSMYVNTHSHTHYIDRFVFRSTNLSHSHHRPGGQKGQLRGFPVRCPPQSRKIQYPGSPGNRYPGNHYSGNNYSGSCYPGLQVHGSLETSLTRGMRKWRPC